MQFFFVSLNGYMLYLLYKTLNLNSSV